jgi:hypothetical protein
MPYTMDDFMKEVVRENLHRLPAEERLAGLKAEELLAALSPEQIEAILRRHRHEKPAPKKHAPKKGRRPPS